MSRTTDDGGAMLDSVHRRCTVTLGPQVESVLFRRGHLPGVLGLSLSDGRRVVVKVRGDDGRIRAVSEIQRRLFAAGYPVPPVTRDLDTTAE